MANPKPAQWSDLMSGYMPSSSSLFPGYDSPKDWRCAYAFLLDCCWTWDDETQLVSRIPDMPHIKLAAQVWHESVQDGAPLVIEKSRRLLMSWVMRGLRLWQMGQNTCTGVLCGLNYAKAANHVWRFEHLYKELRSRKPEMGLAPCTALGGRGERQRDTVSLPNQSVVSTLNQESESFVGEGYTFVDIEEFSRYARPASFYSQARLVTGGRADVVGGQVTVITNADPNLEWRRIKRVTEWDWRFTEGFAVA